MLKIYMNYLAILGSGEKSDALCKIRKNCKKRGIATSPLKTKKRGKIGKSK